MLAFSAKNQSLLTRSKLWAEQQAWEASFESIAGVTRITIDKYGLLKSLLSECNEQDSYLTTPNYYCYTGRKGMWIYQDGDAFVIVCWHPNTSGEILIFPQLVHTEIDALSQLLAIIPVPPEGLRIARAQPSDTIDQCNFEFGDRRVVLRRCEETVLDWKYPVHLLDTARVAVLSGGKFMHIRNRLRQLKNHKVETKPFDAISHSRALENLLHRWAEHNAANVEEYEELYAPYESLFSWSMDPVSALKGLMIFVDDELQAVGLWDVCNAGIETANLFVNFCNVNVPGLSELLIVKSCEILNAEGVAYLNLGGSETSGLDNYKQKFDPIISLSLCSLQVLIEDHACGYADGRAVA